MKFIQMLLGLSASIANFACPWCKVHKDNRWDKSKPWDHYNTPAVSRTVDEIQAAATHGHHFSVKY